MEKLIRIALISILIAYGTYCLIAILAFPMKTTTSHCGIVEKKFNEEVHMKHGSKTDLYLIVQFKGFKKAVNVDILTYSNAKVNTNICLNLTDENPLWFNLSQAIGIIILVVIGFVSLVSVIMFLIFGASAFEFLFK